MKKLLILAVLSVFLAAPAMAQDSGHRAPNTAVGESTAGTGSTMDRNRVSHPNQVTDPKKMTDPTRPVDSGTSQSLGTDTYKNINPALPADDK